MYAYLCSFSTEVKQELEFNILAKQERIRIKLFGICGVRVKKFRPFRVVSSCALTLIHNQRVLDATNY